MARLAKAIGEREDEKRFADLKRAIGEAFVQRFVDADGRLEGDTQTGYLLALDFGVLQGDARTTAARHLRRTIAEADDHLATGFLGVRPLCPVLSEVGETDLAYALLLNDDYPSWLFAVRHGATTIWERWDGWTPDRGFQTANMNSLNHYAYGAVGEWLFRRVAGIDCDPEAPGFRRLVCRPLPHRGLGRVEAGYRAHVGRIAAEWVIDADRVRYRLTVPANVTARIVVPVSAAADVHLEGKPVTDTAVDAAGRGVVVEVGSGLWSLDWPLDEGQ
jgi:alpha-L-rhamnosidase